MYIEKVCNFIFGFNMLYYFLICGTILHFIIYRKLYRDTMKSFEFIAYENFYFICKISFTIKKSDNGVGIIKRYLSHLYHCSIQQ